MAGQTQINFGELRKAHRQARRQARLKRVLSPYAFAGTLDQPVRWHLFYDGSRVVSVVCAGIGKTRSWSAGPVVSVAELAQPEVLQRHAEELLQQRKKEN